MLSFRALTSLLVLAGLSWSRSLAGQQDCIEDSAGDCIELAPQPARVRISIDSAPAASVSVADTGKLVCSTTPCKATLARDRDPIRFLLRAQGYEDAFVVLGSTNKWTTKAPAKLRSCPAISISGEPEVGARLLVNGAYVATYPFADLADLPRLIAEALRQAPSKGCPLQEQDYQIVFDHPTSELAAPERLRFGFGAPNVIHGKMVPKTGTLLVSSAVGRVAVSIDGTPVGVLPSTGSEDVVLEVPRLPVGSHEVRLEFIEHDALRMEENQRWGAFNHSLPFRIEPNGVTRVDFQVNPVGFARNPAYWSADRVFLEEMCDKRASIPSCVALGWARRWGIDGPRDLQGAARSFRQACQLEATEEDAPEQLRACVAYGWLLQVGLAAPVMPEDTPERFYRCSPTSAAWLDPVSPCVRRELSLAAQHLVDPTSYIAAEPKAASRYAFVYTLAAAGHHRLFAIGGGFSASLGRLAFEATLDVNHSSFQRWDRQYLSRDPKGGWGAGLGIGLLYRIQSHLYVNVAPRLTLTSLDVPDDTRVIGVSAGVKVTGGLTWGAVSRRGLFMELGGLFEVASDQLVRPTSTELLEQVLADGDLERLKANRQRGFTFSENFSASALGVVGFAF